MDNENFDSIWENWFKFSKRNSNLNDPVQRVSHFYTRSHMVIEIIKKQQKIVIETGERVIEKQKKNTKNGTHLKMFVLINSYIKLQII